MNKEKKCSQQYHILSVNMGNGTCSECGEKLTEDLLNSNHNL
jgi:hypothetical protein